MKKVMEQAGINDADTVLVTGYSAGGFGAALLADDVFTNYFPDAKSKNVLVDASLLLNNDWHSIATPAVWVPFEEQKKSVAEWLTDAIEGKMSDFGVELIDKKYDYSKTRK